jgi:hypothetical protein
VKIVGRLAQAAFADQPEAWESIPWNHPIGDYGDIRGLIAKIVPGHEPDSEHVTQGGGFYLSNRVRANPVRDTRTFPTLLSKARFTIHPLPDIHPTFRQLLMMTVHRDDQYNTPPSLER